MNKIRITGDCSSETMKARRKWCEILQVLKKQPPQEQKLCAENPIDNAIFLEH